MRGERKGWREKGEKIVGIDAPENRFTNTDQRL